jgi:hypothetical protein
MRWTWLFALTLLLAVGCRRGRAGASKYGLEAFYITADMDSVTAGLSGDTPVSFLADAGMSSQGDVWGCTIGYSAGADIYGGGYTYLGLKGASTISGGDVDFGGYTFLDGTDVTSDAAFHMYKIYVANRTATKGGAINQFAFVLEFLDFAVTMQEAAVPANFGSFKHRSPMLLMGYQWETMAGNSGTSYYASIDWMDLDVIRLGHTGGNFTDVTAGLKWSLGGASAKSQLLIGYKYFEANLKISGNTMNLKYDGPVVGFSAWF